jgi:hypothetical protein
MKLILISGGVEMQDQASDRSNWFDHLLWSQRFFITASQILLAIMITCLAVPVVLIMQRIAPSWHFDYLIPISLIVAFESIYSSRKLQTVPFVELRWWLYHAAEWIIILLIVKAGLYASLGWQDMIRELRTWQDDFFPNFFTLEYLVGIGIILLAWIVSGELAGLLRQLETDEMLIKLQLDSEYFEQRSAIRQRLASMIIAFGALSVVLTTLVRMDSGRLWADSPASQGGVAAVLLYFVLGLALLSLTQFSVLRVRWMLDHVRIGRLVPVRWFSMALGMLLILAFAAVLLPTGYSQDSLRMIQYGLGYLINFIVTIFIILITPLILLIGWLMSLFGSNISIPNEIQPMELIPPPLRQPGVLAPWLEQLLDIFIWVLISGMVVFALVYYYHEHAEVFERAGRSMLLRGLLNVLMSVSAWLRRVKRNIGNAMLVTVEKARRRSPVPFQPINGYLQNLHRMQPRSQVFYYYLVMVRRAGEKIVRRNSDQTPYEYAQTLSARLEALQSSSDQDILTSARLNENVSIEEISELTERFVEARYSQHEITRDHASKARLNWEHIRKLLRGKLS